MSSAANWHAAFGGLIAVADIFQYEQTHNMMQVWTGKLSELQLPVQNPAQEGACTSMSY